MSYLKEKRKMESVLEEMCENLVDVMRETFTRNITLPKCPNQRKITFT